MTPGPVDTLKPLKTVIAVVIGLSIAYGVIAFAYVATTPDVRLRCLLTTDTVKTRTGELLTGLTIQSTEGLAECKGNTPAPGDLLVSLGGERIGSFHDLTRTVAGYRTRAPDRGEVLIAGSNPSADLAPESTMSFVQIEGDGYYAEAWFVRPETGTLMDGWVPLQPQPLGLLTVSLLWLVLQMSIILAAGIAFWHRPYDRPLRLFLLLSCSALVAFVGGSHWWVIFGNPWLLVPFAVSALMLPAVLLHFFLVYPTPKRFFARSPQWVCAAIYTVPVLAAIASVTSATAGYWFSRDAGEGPLAGLFEKFAAEQFARSLPWAQWGISLYLSVGAISFLLSLGALIHSYSHSQRRYEFEQVRSILLAALAATLPLGYALLMAYVGRVDFAFGASQLPLFIAAALFTAAYAIGIVRYRLMLIDQVLDRGLVYYAASAGLTSLFSLVVAIGTIGALHQDVAAFGHPVLILLVLIVAVVLLLWLRDRLQRSIDREFFREKYPLDRALKRMNQAVAGLLDRQTLADRMLLSCREVLQTDRGAIYLRQTQSRTFQLVTASGSTAVVPEFEAPREFLEALSSGLSLQRVRGSSTPIQQLMRSLDAELIHGLDVDGSLAGLIVLGAKPGAAGYNAEDVAFLTALGRLAGVTLHFGKVHEDLSRMQQGFSQLSEELSQRMEDVGRLKSEIESRDSALRQQQRRIESLEQQLSMSQSETPRADSPEFEAPTILGNSPAIRSVLDTVRKTAPTNASVLIRGESGTGKELLARAIHENSPRKVGPLVSVHCAALAPGVLESELFGHVRGAFTDARQDRAGRFQAANGGTLFLDEIGDVPLDTQVKLLRVLQERMIEPVGGAKPIPVDVRLIAATHRDLEQFIAEGKFREDLYYRLNVISIRLPSLKERGDDIIELAVQFLKRARERTGKSVSHFDGEVLERLTQYSWPGNIRELENVVERAVVLAEGDRVTLTDLPPDIGSPGSKRLKSPSMAMAARSTVDAADTPPVNPGMATTIISDLANTSLIGADEEREVLKDALARCHGNKARAARLLGMPRSTYFSKLKKHGLD